MSGSVVGDYGVWLDTVLGDSPPALSFRRGEETDPASWKRRARARLDELLAEPSFGPPGEIDVVSSERREGLLIQHLSWRLPSGHPVQAYFLRPEQVSAPLPGILAFHDHGDIKFFGKEKIVQTSAADHPVAARHRDELYGGRAWANELAKRGYAVLVPDAFSFGSRRVRLADVPPEMRGNTPAEENETEEFVRQYDRWAAGHESVMAKSLFCAGLTWPGVTLAEDRFSLSMLEKLDGVDPARLGCGGLSGGGLRTVFLAGTDERISCAACIGMMTTWRDYMLNRAYTHTWMIYVPHLPRYLDYPEVLALRPPLPVLVQNNIDDPLFTFPEMERAEKMLREIYAKAGAAESLHCSRFPGPHKFDRPMQEEAFSWFDRHLKPRH